MGPRPGQHGCVISRSPPRFDPRILQFFKSFVLELGRSRKKSCGVLIVVQELFRHSALNVRKYLKSRKQFSALQTKNESLSIFSFCRNRASKNFEYMYIYIYIYGNLEIKIIPY